MFPLIFNIPEQTYMVLGLSPTKYQFEFSTVWRWDLITGACAGSRAENAAPETPLHETLPALVLK